MFEQSVCSFINEHSLIKKGSRVLVGVSGGPDSLALLYFLWRQRKRFNLNIVVAHVDHMFRGDESYQDFLHVQAFCKDYGIPFEGTQISVPDYIEKTGKSSQVAARECRFSFFEEVMKKYDIDTLVLGHHGDDQVETILMRFTRGSSGAARAGIPFYRNFKGKNIIRPFLCVTKKEILHYINEHNIEIRIDPSNEKDLYTRNRFRNKVLPFLKVENPNVHEQFQRYSEEVLEDEALLQELTEQKMNTVMEKVNTHKITLDINAFRLMPLPLQRRGIQLILNYLYKEKPSSLSAVHIKQIFSLLNSDHPSAKLNFPNGLYIIRSYNDCSFQFEEGNVSESFHFELYEPGYILLHNGDKILLEKVEFVKDSNGNNQLYVCPDDITMPIIIRNRQNGDRISLKGMNGTKKIKDIFIDEKTPIPARDSWPIVTDSEGTVLWLPNLKKSNLEVRALGNHSSFYYLLTYIKQ